MGDEPKTILCVADDRDLAGQIAEELADRGFEVLLAHEGRAGFGAILKGIPDLVLCDVGLPDMSGFEVLGRLNELSPPLRRIPFVFMGAVFDRESELRARKSGADDYVTKPMDFDILELIINARLTGVARNHIKLSTLTVHEAELLTWVARGKASAEIARIVDMPKRTVDFHLDNVRAKLGTSTRIEAVIKAAFGRLIKPWDQIL
jgi:DNA-binding response OmpR family regulator